LASIRRVTRLSQFATHEGKSAEPRTQEFGLLLGLFTASCQSERRACLIAGRTSKQKIGSATSIRLMSTLPEQPERLVEILRELIALSKSEGNHSELARANNPNELLDAQGGNGIDHTSVAHGKEER